MKFTSRAAAFAALAAMGLTSAVARSGPVSAVTRGPSVRSAASGRAAAAPVPARVTRPAVPGGTQLWVAKYDGGTGRNAQGESVTVSPDGSVVYVSGLSYVRGTFQQEHFDTVAYDAATGATLWKAVYRVGTQAPTGTTFNAVSPDGSQLFVGGVRPGGSHDEYVTLAYNAATGTQQWVTVSPAWFQAAREGLAVSPDGSAVYVSGLGPQVAYHTLALNAATGTQLWAADYPFRKNSNETASSLAVSPDGSKLFVTGQAGTVAYNAATGAQLWADPYRLSSQRRFGVLAVSPDSATLFVTGQGVGTSSVTAAYNAANGARLWQANFPGPQPSQSAWVAVSPEGSAVFVTGDRARTTTSPGVAITVAYNTATGAQLWTSRYAHVSGGMRRVAVSPHGSTVYVLGDTTVAGREAYLAAAYSAATGTRLWLANYTGQTRSDNIPIGGLAASAGGVFASGLSEITRSTGQKASFATVALQP